MRGLSALDRVDAAFKVAGAYYFCRGYCVQGSAPDWGISLDRRDTRLVFEPVTAAMRADPRFGRLMAEPGLDEYWAASGSRSDYRLA